MSPTLEKVMEEAKELSPEELQQLRTLIDSLLTETKPLLTEDEFECYLAAKGVIASVGEAAATEDFHSNQPNHSRRLTALRDDY